MYRIMHVYFMLCAEAVPLLFLFEALHAYVLASPALRPVQTPQV